MSFLSIFPFGNTGDRYKLTIFYRSTDASDTSDMAPTYVGWYAYNEPYSIPSPEIPGYKTLSASVISGTMPNGNYEKKVYYMIDQQEK